MFLLQARFSSAPNHVNAPTYVTYFTAYGRRLSQVLRPLALKSPFTCLPVTELTIKQASKHVGKSNPTIQVVLIELRIFGRPMENKYHQQHFLAFRKLGMQLFNQRVETGH